MSQRKMKKKVSSPTSSSLRYLETNFFALQRPQTVKLRGQAGSSGIFKFKFSGAGFRGDADTRPTPQIGGGLNLETHSASPLKPKHDATAGLAFDGPDCQLRPVDDY